MGNTAKKMELLSPERAIDEISQAACALEWATERLQKMERIKAQVKAGNYQIDSNLVAQAILNHKYK